MSQSNEVTQTNQAAAHSHRYLDDWSWVVTLAQSCERIWNDHGRGQAKVFAKEKAELSTLRRGLQESTELERTKILYIMSLWDSPEVVNDLSVALQFDPCPVVRHEAAYFLGLTHDTAAIEPLGRSMLKDEDELVRHEAAEAIGELGLSEGLLWLERGRTDDSQLVRRTVAIAENYLHVNNS
jgi:HEAT repeat protein